MNKKFFAALASATMAFTASGSIAVFADDFVEESNIVDPNGDIKPIPTKVKWNTENFGALAIAKCATWGGYTPAADKDGYVLTEDLAKVTHITTTDDFDGRVKGLEYFTGLTHFRADKGTVKNETLDFSANVELLDLSVQGAHDLTGLTLPKTDKNEDDEDVYRLEALTVKNSQLTAVDASKYTALNYVNLSSNENLKEVVIPTGKKSAKKEYKEINLSNNALETVNLDNINIKEGKTLNLSNNHIGVLDLSSTYAYAANLKNQTFYISETLENVKLTEVFENVDVFNVTSDAFNKKTGVLTLGDTTTPYTYNTGLNGSKEQLAVTLKAANPMNRLYNPNSGEHFYTADIKEKEALVALGWNDEGYGWVAPATYKDNPEKGKPVYRLYNPNAGDHHYTMSATEAKTLVTYGWEDEGTGWYSATAGVNVWRQYNPYANGAGSHNYTTDKGENDYLVSLGWTPEGKAWTALQ